MKKQKGGRMNGFTKTLNSRKKKKTERKKIEEVWLAFLREEKFN